MSDHLAEFWQWARTAPLPVVLAITLILGGWVWNIAADQRVDQARMAAVKEQVGGIDVKLDKIMEGVADLKAEQRQVRRELQTLHAAKEK